MYPGSLAANGLNVDAAREALLNALAIWNEEAGAHIDLYFAGTIGDVPFVPNAVLVRFEDVRVCCSSYPCLGEVEDNPLATGNNRNCGSEGSGVSIYLRDCNPSATRPWRALFDPGPGRNFMYEGVLVHELGCPIFTGWSNNNGATWTTSAVADAVNTGSRTRPVLEYDAARDRFVLFFIRAADAYIYSTSMPAAGGPWNALDLASSASRYRFLGGGVFHPSGGPNRITAASDLAQPPHRMQQLAVNVDGWGPSYTLGSPSNLGVAFSTYNTRRPFGMAYDPVANRTRVAWRGNNASRALFTADKIGTGPGHFSPPVEVMPNAVNSVDITRTTSQWVVSLSAP